MKLFFKLLFFVIFVPLVPVFIFLLSVNQGGFSAENIKASLVKEDIYSKVYAEMDGQVERALAEGGGDSDDLSTVWPFVKNEISAQYIRGKTEIFIDDTSLWLDDKTKNPPVISFADIKDKLINKNPELIATLEELNMEMKKQKEEAKQMAIDNGESVEETEAQMPDIDLQKIMSSDMSIPVGQKMGPLKDFAVIFKYGLPVVSVILILLAAGIILLSENRQSRFKWTGALLFCSALWCVFIYLGVTGASQIIINYAASELKEVPTFVMPMITAIISPIGVNFLFFEKNGFVVMAVLAVICFAAGVIGPKKAGVVNTKLKLKK